MDIGYMRCSTDKQELVAQRQKLEKAGCERIYEDAGVSGAKRKRDGLDQALTAARAGDRIVVCKLDRLSRSLRDLLNMLHDLDARGVGLLVLDQSIDTLTPSGKLLMHVVGAVAEFERSILSERTKEGMEIARQRGKLKGGQPKLKPAQQRHLMELHEAGTHNVTELAELFGVSRPAVYRTIARHSA